MLSKLLTSYRTCKTPLRGRIRKFNRIESTSGKVYPSLRFLLSISFSLFFILDTNSLIIIICVQKTVHMSLAVAKALRNFLCAEYPFGKFFEKRQWQENVSFLPTALFYCMSRKPCCPQGTSVNSIPLSYKEIIPVTPFHSSLQVTE